MNHSNNFLYHSPCDNCGSRDNKAVYDDGHTYCFGCQQYKKENGDITKKEKIVTDMIDGITEALPSRKIDEETCKKFNYQTGTYKGEPVHIANFYDKEHNRVAQKLRYQDKRFTWLVMQTKLHCLVRIYGVTVVR